MSNGDEHRNIFLGPLRALVDRHVAASTNRCEELEALVAEASEAVGAVTHGRLAWRLIPIETKEPAKQAVRLSLWDVLDNRHVGDAGCFRPTRGAYPIRWWGDPWVSSTEDNAQVLPERVNVECLLGYIMAESDGSWRRDPHYAPRRPADLGNMIARWIVEYAAKGPPESLAEVAVEPRRRIAKVPDDA